MKKKTIQRRVGRKGKYLGLFKKEKRSWSSADSTIEQSFRDFFEAPRPTVAETIDNYESHALAIIEAKGYQVKKPYRFGDSYTHEKGEAILSGLIEMQIGTDEGSLTELGGAAQILTDCHQLRQSMESGNVENTAHHAMLLQRWYDILEVMQHWEYSTLVGENVRDQRRHSGQEGRKNQKKGVADRNKDIIEDFIEGIPIATISKRYKTGVRNVQKLVKPYRKK